MKKEILLFLLIISINCYSQIDTVSLSEVTVYNVSNKSTYVTDNIVMDSLRLGESVSQISYLKEDSFKVYINQLIGKYIWSDNSYINSTIYINYLDGKYITDLMNLYNEKGIYINKLEQKMATLNEIREWLDLSEPDTTHVLIVRDDCSEYPIYVSDLEDVFKIIEEYNDKLMQEVIEVYNLSEDLDTQLMEDRAWNTN